MSPSLCLSDSLDSPVLSQLSMSVKNSNRSGSSVMTSTGLVVTPPSPVIKGTKGISAGPCAGPTTVAELRKSLKLRGLCCTGNKSELIERLMKFQATGRSSNSTGQSTPPSALSNTDRVDCRCKASQGDGVPMVCCNKCEAWSHLSCYCLTEEQAKDMVFCCVKCGGNYPAIAIPDARGARPSAGSTGTTSSNVPSTGVDPVASIRMELAKFIGMVNAQLLSVQDQLCRLVESSVQGGVSERLNKIEDAISKVQQSVMERCSDEYTQLAPTRSAKGTLKAQSKSKSSLRRARGRPQSDTAKPSGLSPSLWIVGADQSNSTVVIGRMIEGIYRLCEVVCPHFWLNPCGSLVDRPFYEIAFPSMDELHAFKDIWKRGVRQNVGFRLLLENPVKDSSPGPMSFIECVDESYDVRVDDQGSGADSICPKSFLECVDESNDVKVDEGSSANSIHPSGLSPLAQQPNHLVVASPGSEACPSPSLGGLSLSSSHIENSTLVVVEPSSRSHFTSAISPEEIHPLPPS